LPRLKRQADLLACLVGAARASELEDPIRRIPELRDRCGEKTSLLRRLLRQRHLSLPLQRIVEIRANARELIGPRGQRIRLTAIEHVAHRETDLVQVVLDSEQLKRIAAVAIGEVRLQTAQA
jgi:hypothetical protein